MLLAINSKGSAVLDLQTKLNRLGYKLKLDGIFGSNTRNAVLDFQRKNKLVSDGIVGPATKAKIDFMASNAEYSRISSGGGSTAQPVKTTIVSPPPASPSTVVTQSQGAVAQGVSQVKPLVPNAPPFKVISATKPPETQESGGADYLILGGIAAVALWFVWK